MRKIGKLLSLLALAGVMIALPVGSVNAMAAESNTAVTQKKEVVENTANDEDTGYTVDVEGRIIVPYSFYESVKKEVGKYGNLSDDGTQFTFCIKGREYIVRNLTREQRISIEDTIVSYSVNERWDFVVMLVIGVVSALSYVGLFITLFKDK